MKYELQISISELASDTNRYIAMLVHQDILITRNEEPVARLTSVKDDMLSAEKKAERIEAAKALFGILPPDINLDQVREERLL